MHSTSRYEHKASDALGIEPTGDIDSFAVNGQGEESSARADNDRSAVGVARGGLEDGESGVRDVKNDAGLPEISPAFLLVLFPILRARGRSVIEMNDFFLSHGVKTKE